MHLSLVGQPDPILNLGVSPLPPGFLEPPSCLPHILPFSPSNWNLGGGALYPYRILLERVAEANLSTSMNDCLWLRVPSSLGEDRDHAGLGRGSGVVSANDDV